MIFKSRMLLNCIFAVSAFLVPHFANAQIASALASERVAVIVSSGDTSGALDESMKDLETKAIQTYEHLGFKVVIVGGANKKISEVTPERLSQTLGNLKGVTDLRLDFLGHGGIGPIADSAKLGAADQNLPALNITPARRAQMGSAEREAIGNKPVFWTALDLTTADSGAGGHYSSLFGETITHPKLLTTDSIKLALQQFRAANPSSATTVNLLNCYSGSVAQALRHESDTIVFGNSPPTAPAIDLTKYTKGNPGGPFSEPDTKYVSSETGLSDYYDLLNGPGATGSVSDARRKANSHFLSSLAEEGDYQIMNVGRSPFYESIVGWCEEYPTENRPQKVIKSEQDLAIFQSVKAELAEVKNTFSKSSSRPIMGALTSESLRKSSYAECVHPPVRSRIQMRMGNSVQEMAGKVGPVETNSGKNGKPSLNQEVGRLADFFLAEFTNADPTEVEDKIMNSIDRTADQLKGVPHDNWGKFAELYEGVQSRRISKSDLLERLKHTLASMKTDCQNGSVHELPCDKYFDYLQDFNRYLPASRLHKPAGPCSTLDYACIHAKGTLPVEDGLYALLEASDTQKPPPGQAKLTGKTLEAKCRAEIYGDYIRELANFRLDGECMERFERSAPRAEWDNLERLRNLGASDARGSGSAPQTAPSTPDHHQQRTGAQ